MHQKIRRFAAWSLSASAAIVVATLATTPVRAQTLYGTLTGNVTDAQGANIPGATVSVRNENTGLELTTVTDETGTYTIRNIPGGTYTLKASIQGFKEYVQTGVSVVVGNIVRVNGRLEIGALSESVTVTTEAVHLKTDKADVSVDLRPEDVTNLPLNQYRNYQTLLNLVPGATPPVFQNAQTDTPGRALTTNVNGVEPQQQRHAHRRRGQHQRLAAPSRGLRRAGRDDRERQHLDQQLRRGAGHDRRRGHGGPDQVGYQHAQGLGVLLPPAGRAQRAARLFRSEPNPIRLSRSWVARWAARSVRTTVLLRIVGTKRRAQRRFNTYTVPTAKMRNGDFSEVLALDTDVPHLRSRDRQSGRHRPIGLRRTR